MWIEEERTNFYIFSVNNNTPNKRNKLYKLIRIWKPQTGSYLQTSSRIHNISNIPLLDDNEIVYEIKKPKVLYVVVAVTKSHIELFNLKTKETRNVLYHKICLNYRRKDLGKRFCFKCNKMHKVEDFYRSSNICLKYIDSEFEYQIHLLRRNHHHKHFKDGCNYNYQRRENGER